MEPNRCRAGWLKKPGVLTGPAALGVNTVLANAEPDAAENMNERYELTVTGRPVVYRALIIYSVSWFVWAWK